MSERPTWTCDKCSAVYDAQTIECKGTAEAPHDPSYPSLEFRTSRAYLSRNKIVAGDNAIEVDLAFAWTDNDTDGAPYLTVVVGWDDDDKEWCATAWPADPKYDGDHVGWFGFGATKEIALAMLVSCLYGETKMKVWPDEKSTEPAGRAPKSKLVGTERPPLSDEEIAALGTLDPMTSEDRDIAMREAMHVIRESAAKGFGDRGGLPWWATVVLTYESQLRAAAGAVSATQEDDRG